MWVILGILLLILIFIPQWWCRWVLARYHRHDERYPGTGGELARHLLDRFDLGTVKVEATDSGDHYDPEARAVRLSPDKLDGKSLTAVAVAVHEVGHAIQDHRGYLLLKWRTQLVRFSVVAQKIGWGVMLAFPLLMVALRSPHLGLLFFVAGLASMGTGVLVHLVTLPVEFDASFRRALPILREGYISSTELRAAKRILTAAALTYVAGALASLLNFWRWLAVLKR